MCIDRSVSQSVTYFLLSPGAALLSGAGIIHRGTRGSGGFIAAKLFTYDYSRHIKADAPPAIDAEPESKDFVLPVSSF